MDIFFEEILKNKNKPIIEEEYDPQNHLILSKYTSKAYYKYSIELLKTLIEKAEYTNKKYIFHMSLHYLLKILYNFQNLPYIDNYDLLILSSFSLGIKSSVDQHKMPFITKLKKIYPEKFLFYSNEKIQECEIICMKLLDYNINILTSYECLFFYFNRDTNKFPLLIKELENIIFNDVNKILFKSPYELAKEVINKLNFKIQYLRQPLLITKKTAPFLNKRDIKAVESSPTTSVSSSYGSYSNTRNNFNTKRLKGLRSFSNMDINDKNIINSINKELNSIYNNNNYIIIRENKSARKQDNNIIINNKNNVIKKVIYKNNNINKNDNKIIKINDNNNNNIKLLKNPVHYKLTSNDLYVNTSSSKNITSQNISTNFQINRFICFSGKKTILKTNSKINIMDNNLKIKNNINHEKLTNNLSMNNLKKTRVHNTSGTTIFKKPTIDKKKMKTSFKNNKNIKNARNNKKNINFNTALKNCNIHYSKISDLCKKINFDVFNSIPDKDKSHN